MSTQWVIAEHAEVAWELISGCRTLAEGTVTAFVGGGPDTAKSALEHGASVAVSLPLPQDALWEGYAAALVERARDEQPAYVLVEASKRGRSLAALLAAHLDVPCISDGKGLAVENGRLTAARAVMGGLATKQVSCAAATVIVTVGPGVFTASPAQAAFGAAETLSPVAGKAKVVGRHMKESAQVNLGAARYVLGVGRGFASKEDLALAQQVADALGAELACSRPIAEFNHWMPEERYIGISGQVIKPEIYIAAGISGQPQHVFGIRDSKIIVSINKDEGAPMNQLADYYFVGDLKQILPELARALAADRKLTAV